MAAAHVRTQVIERDNATHADPVVARHAVGTRARATRTERDFGYNT